MVPSILLQASDLIIKSILLLFSAKLMVKIICREIDEALRPGVYALIDACSADDLQHIHTVFGGKSLRFSNSTLV